MMPSMPPDTHKISIKVIEAVKEHPVLYINEVKSSVLKLQEFRQKVWKRISDELGLDSNWVKLRWKNLRDTYCRILKYKNKTEKGIRRKKWIFEEHLGFLKFPYEVDYEPQCVVLSDEYVREINDGGMSSDDLLEQLEDRNDDDYSEYLELEETSADPTLSSSKRNRKNLSPPLTDSEEPLQKKMKINTVEEIESKFRKIQPKYPQIDESLDTCNFNIIPNSRQFNTGKSSNFPSNKFLQVKNVNNLGILAKNVRKPILIAKPASPTITKKVTKTNAKFVEETNVKDDKLMKSSLELFFDSMAQTVKKLPSKAQADIKLDISRIITNAESKLRKSIPPKKPEISKFNALPKLVLIPCSMIDKRKN